MERCHLVSVCWIFMIIAIFPDLLSAATTSESTTVTTPDTQPTITTPDTQPTITTPDTQPTVTTQDTQPTVTTQDTQPTVTTQDTQPTVTTQDTKPTVTTQDTQPTVTTQDTQPTVTTQDTPPTVTTQDTQPTVTTQDTQPTVTTQDTQPTVTTQDTQPTVTTQDTQPTVTTQDTPPTVTTPDTQPTVTTPDTQPTVTTQDTQPTVTTQDTQPTVSTPDTQPTVTTQDTQPTVTTPDTQPTVTTPDTQPTVTTQDTQPAETSQDTQPTETTLDTQPTETTLDTQPTVTTQDTQPTVTTQDTQPTVTTQDTQPTETTLDTQPTETTLDTQPTETTLSSVSSTDLTSLPSTAQSTVAPTDAPVTGAYKPDLDNLIIKLNFTISIDLAFNPKLNDKSSNDYKDLEKEFIDELTHIYKKLERFVKITILGFREGSTVAMHQVEVGANSNNVNEEMLNVMSSEIQNLTINGTKVINSTGDDIQIALDQFGDKCNAVDICGSDLKCERGTTDSPYCVCRPDYCQNDGICRAHSKEAYYCSCKSTDDYVFSGDRCEIRTEKHALSEGAIIGIASGLGGGVLILVIVIFGCLRCAKARKNKDRDSQSYDGDLPELSFPNLDKMRMSQLNQGNDYDGKGKPNYGFEPEPTDLRYHRKFDHGRDQGTFFQRKEMDYSPRGSQNMKREMYSGETSYNSYDELNALDNPESRLSRDFSRSSNLRRSSYNQTDEPRAGDSRRSSQMRSKGNDPGYQLLTGSIREGDSVFQHINTERPYTIMRPNFR